MASVNGRTSSTSVTGTVTVDSELAAAAALNGTIAKSVVAPVVGAALLVSDNTNFIQPLGDATNGLDVDVTRMAALIAGEAHIGEVGGHTISIKDTTAVSTSPAYTAGDAIGALRTLTNAMRVSGGTGILQSIAILDRANQKAAMNIYIFDANPAAATITDNAAFVFSTDDLKVVARVSVGAGDYVTDNSKATVTLGNLGIGVTASGSRNLFAVAVAVSTPTYVAVTDVQITFVFLND